MLFSNQPQQQQHNGNCPFPCFNTNDKLTIMDVSKFDENVIKTLYGECTRTQISEEDEKLFELAKSNDAYGELTFQGVRTLMQETEMTKDDVFYDLGCGVGKVVLQIACESPVQKAVGIELSKARYTTAVNALKQLESYNATYAKKVGFINDNIVNGYNYTDATILYSASTCFGKIMVEVAKYASMHCKKLKYLVADLPYTENFVEVSKYLEFVKIANLETSWRRGDGSRMAVFKLKRNGHPYGSHL